MKMFEIVIELSSRDRDTKRANAIGKMTPIDWLKAGSSQIFSLYKTQCLQSTIKRSRREVGKPVHAFYVITLIIHVTTL